MKLKRGAIIVVMAMLAPFAIAGGPAINMFEFTPFALRVGAPSTWRYAPQPVQTGQFQLQSQNFADLVNKQGSIPIVRFERPVSGNKAISPTVQVLVEASGGRGPQGFLVNAIKSAAATLKDYHLIQKPSGTTLNGMSAGYEESSFTATSAAGKPVTILSQSWAISHDDVVFVISVTAEPNDVKTLNNELKAILGTFRFTD